jgi:solute carrier family 9B (sodium/hydrogen exchanger), member 1/2
MPKATVQAALGSVVLDRARDEIAASSPDREDYEDYGNFLLTAAVLSILLTAPLGAFLTNNLGVRWLNKTEGGNSTYFRYN